MKKLRSLPRNLWAMTFGSFFTDISSEMIVHLIPLYLANVLGAKTTAIGLIEGIAETTASLVKIISGRLSDQWGRRKELVVAGYSLSTIAKPFLAFANTWPTVLAVRFFDRLGKGIRTAPRDALIANSISSEHRGLAFGLHRAGDTAGATIGLAIAFGVVWFTQRDADLLQIATFRTLVWLSIIPAALAVLILLVFLHDQRAPEKFSPTSSRLAWADLDPRFRMFLFIVVIFTFGNASDAFLALRAQERGASIATVLGMLFVFNLIYTLAASPASALSDRIGRRTLLVGGWCLYAGVYAGFAFVQAAWQIWIFYGLYGLYYAMTEGVAKALIADLVPEEQRGTAYGWFNGAIGLVLLPANIFAGFLWQGAGSWGGFGAHAPFIFGALMSLTAATLLFTRFPNAGKPG